MNNAAIVVENIGKCYQINHEVRERYSTLREMLVRKATAPLGWFRARSRSEAALRDAKKSEDFWALKDVSFSIGQGEVVGIIGRNGAGKSTLLKILSRITEPTVGRMAIRGRVASLLEVGTGFHPELTGRENVFLNGAILGMNRDEIKRKFDEIVAFAEVEKFLDTPVKRYSSGMYVRLAFAVAAHLEPKILVVDEVLAVGDAAFQRKCLGKMESVAKGHGRTVLFVSHNMAAIEVLCSSAILLSEGRVKSKGETAKIVQEYLTEMSHGARIPLGDRRDRDGSGALRFTAVSLANGDGQKLGAFQCGSASTLALEFENTSGEELKNVRVAVGIDNDLAQRVLLLDSILLGQDVPRIAPGRGVVRFVVPKLSLVPGRYHFTIFSTVNGTIADWIKGAGSFNIEGGDYFGTGQLPPQGQGIFMTEHKVEYAAA